MTLVIMAAGMGSRFGGLKQIEPVGPNGEFIIDYSIYDAIKAGFTKVVFIIKEENYDIFKQTVGKRIEGKIKVEYAFQSLDKLPDGIKIPKDRVKPLGTAQALFCAKENINEPFAVISSDDFYGQETFNLLAESLKKENEYSVIGYEIGNTLPNTGEVKRGVCFEKNGIVTDIIESKVNKDDDKILCTPLDGSASYEVDFKHPASMLMYGMQPEILKFLDEDIKRFFQEDKIDLLTAEYLLPTALNDFSNKNHVDLKLISTPAVWKGVTYHSDLDELKAYILKLIEEGIYPVNLYE